MTDHDRGAYTPPTDEALAFDPRRQSERRPIPMTLVGSAVVLVVLIVGVAVVYRGGVRGANEAPRPIGQPVVAVKTPPPNTMATGVSAGEADDGEGKSAAVTAPSQVVPPTPPAPAPAQPTALASEAANAKPTGRVSDLSHGPTFAPAPEQPAPRPVPAAKTLAAIDRRGETASPAQVKATPAPGKPIRTVGGLDASEVAAAGMTSAAPARSTLAATPLTAPIKVAAIAPKPKAAHTAAVAASAPTVSSVGGPAAGGPVVQIGAFSSAALSDQGYADVSRIMVGHMAGKAKHVMTVDHAGATLFRTWVSGFASRAEAGAFCAALKAHSKPCFVKG